MLIQSAKKPFIERIPPDLRVQLQEDIMADPVAQANILLGFDPWTGIDKTREWYTGKPGQAEMLEAPFRHKKIVVPTGHSTGKTYFFPRLIFLWLMSHCGQPGESPFAYVVVSGAVWTSIKRHHFGGLKSLVRQVNKTWGWNLPMPQETAWMLDEQWGAIGLSPNDAEAAQGYHSTHGTLVLIDEASHLSAEDEDPWMSNVTGDRDAFMYVGNPIKSSGAMVNAILDATENPNSTWFYMNISTLDTPNVVVGREVVPGLATPSRVADMMKKWAPGTPSHDARILGLVPDQDEESFIGRQVIRACGERQTIPWQEDTNRTLSVDVARSAVGDQTVFFMRGDHSAHLLEKYRGLAEGEILDLILDYTHRYQVSKRRTFVDATGVGSGLSDRLEEHGFPPTVRVMNGASAENPKDYRNRKAENYARLRDVLRTLAVPKEMVSDLMEIAMLKCSYLPGTDQLSIQTKDDFKTDNGFSPDIADACALSCASPVGLPAFPAASLSLKLHRIPTVCRRGDFDILHLDGYDAALDQPGKLVRATWVSRSNDSACVVAHIDAEGCWSVVDALTESLTNVRAFWQRISEKWGEHRFAIDVIATPQEPEARTFGQTWEVANGIGRSMPIQIAPVDGAKGLAVLDRLIVSSIARFPEDAYWSQPQAPKIESMRDDAMLFVYPDSVLDAILFARRKPADTFQKDIEEEATDELVAGGGPIIRCLRMLAVSV